MNLADIRDATRQAWPFTHRTYPAMSNLNVEERRAFALKHVLVHMVKATGQVSAAIEPIDHGMDLDRDQLLASLRNLIVQAVQCADVAGISEADIEQDLSRWYKTIKAS